MNTTPRGVAAATLLILPVVTELVSEPTGDTTGFKLAFAASQVIGWLLVTGICRNLAEIHRPANRRDRAGARMLLAGCVAEVLFAGLYGVLELSTGSPEASFVLFSLGFLLITVGGLLRGTELHKAGARLAGGALITAAVLGLLAIAVGSDPFHDIFLLSGYAAWAVVGLGVARSRESGLRDLATQTA